MTKKMSKFLIIIGALVLVMALSILCAVLISDANPDFSGTVKSIKESDGCVYITVEDDFYDTIYKIEIKSGTKIRNDSGDKISADEIRVGDEVSIAYRGKYESEDAALTAKRIEVRHRYEKEGTLVFVSNGTDFLIVKDEITGVYVPYSLHLSDFRMLNGYSTGDKIRIFCDNLNNGTAPTCIGVVSVELISDGSSKTLTDLEKEAMEGYTIVEKRYSGIGY